MRNVVQTTGMLCVLLLLVPADGRGQTPAAPKPAAPAAPASPEAVKPGEPAKPKAGEGAKAGQPGKPGEPAKAGESAALPASAKGEIEKAIQALILEARELDVFEDPKHPAVFTRPHPTLKNMDKKFAPALLNRMSQKLTGNDYTEAYIRWHCMWLIKQCEPKELGDSLDNIRKLLEEVPGDLRVAGKVDHEIKPMEIYNQWAAIYYGKLSVTVGYPPFQKTYRGPDAFPYMDASRKAEAEALWVTAQELRKKFEIIVDPKARAFNNRISAINHLVRRYMGELVYELSRSGDPRHLQLIIRIIDKMARAKTTVAFDMMNYLYQAAFDGYLENYTDTDLRAASKALEATARATEADWIPYGYLKRNFAQYAFHLIESLNVGDTFNFKK